MASKLQAPAGVEEAKFAKWTLAVDEDGTISVDDFMAAGLVAQGFTLISGSGDDEATALGKASAGELTRYLAAHGKPATGEEQALRTQALAVLAKKAPPA